jgi:hypothetical protein
LFRLESRTLGLEDRRSREDRNLACLAGIEVMRT